MHSIYFCGYTSNVDFWLFVRLEAVLMTSAQCANSKDCGEGWKIKAVIINSLQDATIIWPWNFIVFKYIVLKLVSGS